MSALQKEMEGELGTNASDVWKLRKALYVYAGSSRLWWDKVSAWLRNYGFRALGNSGTFMMLDRRNADEESMQGIILLNLYSDDGLASIDNSTLWDKFMLNFQKAFDVVEKDPDYFLGCAIEWEPGRRTSLPYTSSGGHEDLCKRELGWRREVQELVSAILRLH